MAKIFNYEKAKSMGYSDDEIKSFLEKQPQPPKYDNATKEDSFLTRITKNASNFYNNFSNPAGTSGKKKEEQQENKSYIDQKLLKKNPKFNVNKAYEMGYDDNEINDFLRSKIPKQSKTEKGARIAAQYGLGVLEGSASGMAYDIAVSPLASKEAQQVPYRQNVMEDIERLQEQKQAGVWDEQDQELYDNLIEQVKDTSKSDPYIQIADLSIRGLAEKATGQDLHPEGILEKGAQWAGFIKNPKNISNLLKIGLTPKTLTKAFLPGPTEAIRGLSAGTALQMAEEGNFGPLGTIGSAIAGDLIGHAPKAIGKAIINPKQTIARGVNLITGNNSRKLISKQLAEDFNKSGLKIDAGTLTQSPLIQMMQARLVQSGLTGNALNDARKELSQQITREYENIMKEVGDNAFENSYQASEAIKDALKVEEVALNVNTSQPSNIPDSHKGRSLKGRISTQPVNQYEQTFLNRIAPQFESDAQAGLNLQTAANDIKNPIKEEFNHRWTNMNERIAELPPVFQPELEQELAHFIENHRGSILLGESTAEYKVYQDANRLFESIRNRNQMGVPSSLKELIMTKQTLADIANWEFGGSNFESAYKKLVGDLDRAIERSLEAVNPELLEGFQALNADYAAFKNEFENKNVKNLFSPKNENYNSLHNEFISDADKLRSLEDIFYNNPRGQELINQVKRDYAQKIIEKPGFDERDARNLIQTLGPEFEQPIHEFLEARAQAIEHPLPRASRRAGVGVQVQTPQTQPSINVVGRNISETGTEQARQGVRKKMYEYLTKNNKTPDQIMKSMDSIEGIRKLRRALELTPEGRELFKELSRYKFAEMIDKKMKDNITDQVKLGTFSNLLKTTKDKAIAIELLGKDAFDKLNLLQKNSGQLAKSAEKFFNASNSGTTLLDMGLVGTAVTGILMGNPFMALPAMAKIGGSYIMANLFADPVFLKELEKAILTNNPKKFTEYLEKMRPSFEKAIANQQRQSIKDQTQNNTQ